MSKKEPKNKSDESRAPSQSTLARSEDGSVQITFKIPFDLIEKTQKEVAQELGNDIEVPGFRKGRAPLNKVIGQIPKETLIEKSLAKILPKLVGEAIDKHEVKPAIYPRFELLSAEEGKDWQIRALTCEIPEIELGDYKKNLLQSKKTEIWTPQKAGEEKPKQKSREEKEQEVIETLLEVVKIKVPKLLVDDEVNSRLSRLLERMEKLGLTLESYLASIGKTAQALREEYEKQARQAIALELILGKVAQVENIKIEQKQIDEAIKAGSTDPELAKKLDTPEQRRVIESVLKRRNALDSLVSLM